jgi:hypothetical protein
MSMLVPNRVLKSSHRGHREPSESPSTSRRSPSPQRLALDVDKLVGVFLFNLGVLCDLGGNGRAVTAAGNPARGGTCQPYSCKYVKRVCGISEVRWCGSASD